MADTYRSIQSRASSVLKVKGSRFIAEAIPVETREEAENEIENVRMRERDANHHCMAYRLGMTEDLFRYDDDGEPSGTAGAPILRQIDARELTNTLVVVTRYFGGTELGTGGLMRAYADAASEALDRASLVEKVVRVPVRLEFAYDDTSPVEQLLHQFDAEVQRRDYSEVTELTVGVRKSEKEAFLEAFTDALSDRGRILRVGREAMQG